MTSNDRDRHRADVKLSGLQCGWPYSGTAQQYAHLWVAVPIPPSIDAGKDSTGSLEHRNGDVPFLQTLHSIPMLSRNQGVFFVRQCARGARRRSGDRVAEPAENLARQV